MKIPGFGLSGIAGSIMGGSRGCGALEPGYLPTGVRVAALCAALLGFASGGLAASGVSELKSDEQIVFYPTLAMPATNGGWNVRVHGCVFEVERRRLSLGVLRAALRFDGIKMSRAEAATFRERARLFFADNERGHRVVVRIGDQIFELGESAPNGHFARDVHVAPQPGDLERAATRPRMQCGDAGLSPTSQMEIVAVLRDGDARRFTGVALVLPASGISVVSDVDDTIKISDVLDHRALIRRTFLEPFKAVPGMAELYRQWATNGASFHYVSASPWQIYPLLNAFAATNGFPTGAWNMKAWRLKDRTFKSLFDDPGKYKVEKIRALMLQSPERRFVLVGDSGERDPEAYALLAREFRSQVKAIYIRDVTGQDAKDIRYQTNFSGLPAGLWRVFKEPEEMANGFGFDLK